MGFIVLIGGEDSHSARISHTIQFINNVFKEKRKLVVCYFNTYKKVYDSFHSDTKFQRRLPTTEDITMMPDFSIMIIDGFENDLNKDHDILKIVSVLCHEKELTIVMLLEDIFPTKNEWVSKIIQEATLCHFDESGIVASQQETSPDFGFQESDIVASHQEASADFVCHCNAKLGNKRSLAQHKKIMHGDYIYVCNIKSVDTITGKETECVSRIHSKGNFRKHLQDKHDQFISLKNDDHLKWSKPKQFCLKWNKRKRIVEIKYSQECFQCNDCRKARNPRKNAAKNPRNRSKSICQISNYCYTTLST